MDNKNTVYHYTKIGAAVEDILYQRRLKLSKGINTNDPREYKHFDFSPHLDGICSYEKYREIWRQAEKGFAKCKSQYKYSSFCLNDSLGQNGSGLPGYGRLRMWSQYGQNFYGVCIAFSAQRLQKKIRDGMTFYAKPVEYADLECIDTALSDIDAAQLMRNNADDWALSYIRHNMDYIFFTKHKDYRDEKEYRIVIHDPENSLEYIDIAGCVKAVLLGDRTEAVYHKIAKDLSSQMNAECKQVVWHSGKLHLKEL